MKYNLFLFDADDTLFDFKASEKHAFAATLKHHGLHHDIEALYLTYGNESLILWREVEQGKITKDFLKAERFRRTFAKHGVSLSAEAVGETYLELLPETCVLIDQALEVCQTLSQKGRIGIITNGFENVQKKRLSGSPLAPYIQFVIVSEQAGHAKPDTRFFEYTEKMIGQIDKSKTLVIGDRLEADIEGAHNYGLDSCWFNPHKKSTLTIQPKYEINHLSQLLKLVT
jgi:2-haloacid dehalogenase